MIAALRVLPIAAAQARRAGSKGLLVALVSAATAASLVAALAIGSAIERNTRSFFCSRYSGELVVAEGESGALFGYAAITGNERQEVIRKGPEVEAIVARQEAIASAAPLLCGFLSLGSEEGRETRCIAFGIDPERPGPSGLGFALEPGSRLPGPGEILLSSALARRLAEAGSPGGRGEAITACALKDAGLALRPLRIAGAYEYSGGVSELDSIVYLEAGTARRLLLDAEDGPEAEAPVPAAREAPRDDELFSAGGLVEEAGAGGGKAGASEAASAAEEAEAARPAPPGQGDGGWHYIRLRLAEGADPKAVALSLNASFVAAGLGARALGWEDVSSGYAQSAGIVRAVLLACIAVAAAFALLVVGSSLDLLARSRAREDGTARAIGAKKSFVLAWTLEEVLVAAAAGAAAGAALSCLGLALISAAAPPLGSPILRELLASERFAAPPAIAQALAAAAIALAAAALAAARAALRSSRIPPADAMRDIG